jgi:hypothetical protein
VSFATRSNVSTLRRMMFGAKTIARFLAVIIFVV